MAKEKVKVVDMQSVSDQTQIIEAVYENGMFRPVSPVSGMIKEGEKVRLPLYTVDMALRALEDLTHTYDGLSEAEIKEIEKAILNRNGNSGSGHPDVEQSESQLR